MVVVGTELRRSDSVERQSLELNLVDGMAAQADSSQIAATLTRTDSIQVKPRERKSRKLKERKTSTKRKDNTTTTTTTPKQTFVELHLAEFGAAADSLTKRAKTDL